MASDHRVPGICCVCFDCMKQLQKQDEFAFYSIIESLSEEEYTSSLRADNGDFRQKWLQPGRSLEELRLKGLHAREPQSCDLHPFSPKPLATSKLWAGSEGARFRTH